MKIIPTWLNNAVAEGLQMLVVLRLRGTPAEQNLAQTGKVWIGVITSRPIAWDEEQDSPRICNAFIELAATMDRWPAPADFMRVLQPRKQLLSLPKPDGEKMTAENRKMLDDLLSRMRNGTTRQ